MSHNWKRLAQATQLLVPDAALLVASVLRHTDVLKLLLQRGAEPNQFENGVRFSAQGNGVPLIPVAQTSCRTPLHHACMHGDADACLALLNAGAKIESRDHVRTMGVGSHRVIAHAPRRTGERLYLCVPPRVVWMRSCSWLTEAHCGAVPKGPRVRHPHIM